MSTILVVDDAAVSREPLALVLRLNGYEVIRAANGRDALELLESDAIHLVLLDLVMPEMGGVEFLRVLRGDSRWADLPVIVLTGQNDDDVIRQVRKLGVKDCLVKSRYSIETLLDHVQRTLSLADPRQQEAAFEGGYHGV